MAMQVDKEKCKGCAACVPACPVEAIEMKDGVAVIDDDNCIVCGACIAACPAEAITMKIEFE